MNEEKVANNEAVITNNEPVKEVVIEEAPIDKKLTRKEKRYNKIRNRLFKENDIKYEGPLSYRYLRILAWVFMALGQILFLNSLNTNMMHYDALGDVWTTILSTLSSLSTPLFILASFGLVLNGKRNIRDFMLVYGLAYVGMGLGFIIFYLRYIKGLFVELGLADLPFTDYFDAFLSYKVQVNVFADLFAFAIFHFFLNYNPRKIFKGKSIYAFRLFSLMPVIFVLVSYIIKILTATGKMDLPFYIFPFLTTKSPIIYLIFIVAAMWIKNRERWYLKLGASKHDYQEFLKTKRNSLSVSIHLSIIIAVASLLDIVLLIIAMIYYFANDLPTDNIADVVIGTFGVGQAFMMLLAIPFIFLYSYKRKHKDGRIDLIIPVLGIALMALIYVEGIYQFILEFVGSH